jgi:tellurite resistance protein TerB
VVEEQPLTGEEVDALKLVADFKNPVLSPAPGSNLWPLVHIWWRGKTYNGETFNRLLMRGYLGAKRMKEERFVQKHKNPEEYPDLYVTHRLRLTMKGRAAINTGRKSMFGKLFGGKAKEAMNAFSGNRDFLEGMCAGCALVAAADGKIEDDEFDQTLRVIQANSAIAAGFNAQEIETTFSKLSQKTGSRSGKSELKTEIREAIERDKTGSMGNAIVLACLDVADQGGISDVETAILKDIANLCGVNYEKALQG